MSEKQQDQQPAVREITAQNFNSWRHHPVTKLVMEFFELRANLIKDQALEQWVNGTETEVARAESRSAFRVNLDFINLQFDHLLQAFNPPTEDDGEPTPLLGDDDAT